jgi:adenosine deaminase
MDRSLIAVVVIAGLATGADASERGEFREELIEWKLRWQQLEDEKGLRQFIYKMPKGADLHSHLSGAVTTELLIDWGAADGLCIDAAFAAAPPPCAQGSVPLANQLSNPTLFKDVLGAWSMEGFQGTLLEAHQHFFDTFGKFGAALSDARTDDAIADVLSIAARNHQIYVELMQGLNSSKIGELASKYILPADPWDEQYLLEKRAQLAADPLFQATLEKTKSSIERSLEGARKLLGCDTPRPDPGCGVGVRFLVSANRTRDRGYVFGQWAFGFELAQVSPSVVGVELVSPEENANSLRYYGDEMFAMDVLRRFNLRTPARRPVHISLHAGELIPEVLPPTPEGQRHLEFHIRDAVEIAHVERIGHGADVFDEDRPLELMRKMRDANVMVEICLTSNARLLGKQRRAHPVNEYLEHRVPVALATDDEGVLRIDIADEFLRAVELQKLSYRALKRMVRTSLEHSFLPGASLWRSRERHGEVAQACARDELGEPNPSFECARFLQDSERAAMQWRLEAELNAFEEEAVEDVSRFCATGPTAQCRSRLTSP